MKNMRILIDTNIIVDWLLIREPFHKNAEYVMEKSMMCDDVEGFLTAHMMSDLFYILRKRFSVEKRKELLLLLCNTLEIIPENKQSIKETLSNENWSDLEDGLQIKGAEDKNLDYIVTRNIKDFKYSKVAAIMPEQFIEMYEAWQKNSAGNPLPKKE